MGPDGEDADDPGARARKCPSRRRRRVREVVHGCGDLGPGRWQHRRMSVDHTRHRLMGHSGAPRHIPNGCRPTSRVVRGPAEGVHPGRRYRLPRCARAAAPGGSPGAAPFRRHLHAGIDQPGPSWSQRRKAPHLLLAVSRELSRGAVGVLRAEVRRVGLRLASQSDAMTAARWRHLGMGEEPRSRRAASTKPCGGCTNTRVTFGDGCARTARTYARGQST